MTKNLNTVIKANGKTYFLNFGMSAFIKHAPPTIWR